MDPGIRRGDGFLNFAIFNTLLNKLNDPALIGAASNRRTHPMRQRDRWRLHTASVRSLRQLTQIVEMRMRAGPFGEGIVLSDG
jgi:hypothetical protein